MTSILDRSAVELRDAIVSGDATATDAVDASFTRARDVGAGRDGLNILLYQDRHHALSRAAECDALAGSATAPSLLGVPVVIKDNIATSVMPTSCGSRILEGYVSPYAATAVEKLSAAGAIIVAKSNMDEFAMGSSTEHSAFGPAKHPLAPDRVPGGSSGGSVAAVAAGIARIALGSETGGSVRQPAAFCGVVGVKPTYGRVSRYGLVAFASSLDHIGVVGRTVDDAAIGLEVISGLDPLDSTSADQPVPRFRDAARGGLTGVVIGRPKEYFPDDLDPRIRERCDAALDHMRTLGAGCARFHFRTQNWRSRSTTSSRRRKHRRISRALMVLDMGYV